MKVASIRKFSRLMVKVASVALILMGTLTGLSGCVTYIPVDEYTLARAAYDAAKDADSARYAPALWFNAEQAYREAQKAFRERRYDNARSLFSQSKDLSEKAENAARLARYQSGEIVP